MHSALERLGRILARRPIPVLAAGAAVAVLSAVAAAGLRIETDIAKMLPADNPAARSFTEISDAFSTTSVLAVVVEGEDREAIARGAEAFAERLKTDRRTADLVRSTRVKLDAAFVDSWGFMLQETEDIAESGRTLRSTRLVPLLGAVNDLMEEKLSDGDDEEVEGPDGEDDAAALMARFALFARDLRGALESGEAIDAETGDRLAESFLIGDRYFFDPEGRSLLMTATPSFDLGDRAKLTALMEGARGIAAEIQGASFSFAGDVASEADEEEAIGADLFYPSLISIALIMVLFFFSFHGLRSIMFAVAALIVGIAAALGFAAIAVGELNMVTSSFGALLVGLGIDFGIHIASRFDELSESGLSTEEAMTETFGAVVLPVSVGAMTTAVAFYALCFSRTSAFRQFGAIAGTGILTTLAASVTVLPALLAAFPKRRSVGKRRAAGKHRAAFSYRSVAKLAARAAAARGPVLAAAAAATVLAVVFIPRNGFEYDMRRIGPQGTDAQATEEKIGDRFGISTYQALATAGNLEEARNLAERIKDAPLIRRVESLADYVPSAEEQSGRLAAIREIAAGRDRAGPFIWDDEAVAAFVGEVRRLEMNLIELGDLAAASLGEDSLPVRARSATIREVFGAERGKSGEEVYTRLVSAVEDGAPEAVRALLAAVDGVFAAALDRRVTAMSSVDRPIAEEDLPGDILSDFRSPDGARYLVVAQPSRGLAGNDAVVRFADGLAAVDAAVTGSLVLGVELSREMMRESRVFAAVVLALVLVLVGITFRSVAATAVAALPFAAGIVWTFGLYPAVGQFNIVNALSIPLILGIGIDYAVHFLSAIRSGRAAAGPAVDLESALARTGKAVFLSALTTMIGFGSLAFAGRFKGIADLGATLLIGIGCCLVAAVLVLPAAETFFHEKSKGGSEGAAEKNVREAI
jgi:hypothetical protein